MLVLTRKAQEVVIVGGPDDPRPVLTITVLDIVGGTVRLGFQADASVLVHRWEVWQRIQAASLPSGRAPPAGG
jgi:carbon storage regulator CsrA